MRPGYHLREVLAGVAIAFIVGCCVAAVVVARAGGASW